MATARQQSGSRGKKAKVRRVPLLGLSNSRLENMLRQVTNEELTLKKTRTSWLFSMWEGIRSAQYKSVSFEIFTKSFRTIKYYNGVWSTKHVTKATAGVIVLIDEMEHAADWPVEEESAGPYNYLVQSMAVVRETTSERAPVVFLYDRRDHAAAWEDSLGAYVHLLEEISQSRPTAHFSVSTTTGEGLQTAFDWIVESIQSE